MLPFCWCVCFLNYRKVLNLKEDVCLLARVSYRYHSTPHVSPLYLIFKLFTPAFRLSIAPCVWSAFFVASFSVHPFTMFSLMMSTMAQIWSKMVYEGPFQWPTSKKSIPHFLAFVWWSTLFWECNNQWLGESRQVPHTDSLKDDGTNDGLLNTQVVYGESFTDVM
jgi:hypothetical protein